MSDSGFTGLPPRTGISDSGFPPSRADLKAQIIEVRGRAAADKTRQRMDGEIIRHEDNGHSRIRTDKGEVTVRFQTRNPPPEGARVQIELPPDTASRPRMQATIQVRPDTVRTTPPPPQQQAPQNRPPPLAPLAPDTIRTASEPSAATSYSRARSSTATAAALQTGQLIRLLPYTGAVLQQEPPLAETIRAALRLPPVSTALSTTAFSAFPSSGQPLTTTLQNKLSLQSFMPPSPLLPENRGAAFPFRSETTLQLPPALLTASPYITASGKIAGLLTAGTESPALTGAERPPATPSPAPIDARITGIVPVAASITKPDAPVQDMPSMVGNGSDNKIPASFRAGEGTALVIGRTPDGMPVLSLFSGTDTGNRPPPLYALQFRAANLPGGSFIHYIPQTTGAAIPAATAANQQAAQTGIQAPTLPLPISAAPHWPAFEELIQTLQQTSPQTAQAVSNTIPNPANPAAMAPAILFFVAAMRGGDIQSWLGEKALEILRRAGKADISGRLTREASTLARMAAEPVSQDWRTLSLPLYWNGDVQKLQLYYRHDRPPQKDDKDTPEKQGTRFIFDLALDRMGNVQLDGLHRPANAATTDAAINAKNGRLDLILRTVRPVSDTMQQKMRQTYYSALTQAGIHGELQFQGTPERFLKINTDTPHHESII